MYVADLHCDLLAYLASDERRSPLNGEVRCSIPQLKKGNVVLQTLAIFTETGKKSVLSAEKQFSIFCNLPKLYPDDFSRLDELKLPEPGPAVHIVAAIENASGLCDESESIDTGLARLDRYIENSGPLIYLSLTWNHENRFGGGNFSKIGLKRDGEILLDYLSEKNIAIDLSHTSDALAEGILNYIDKKGLRLIPIASHSNFRQIANQPRNLPNEFAQEIVHRGGVIGFNFVKGFVGRNYPEDFMRQVDYARSLGAWDQFCFGADFFYEKDAPLPLHPFLPFFYEEFSDSSSYPLLIEYLNEVFTKQELEKIALKNLGSYFERINKRIGG